MKLKCDVVNRVVNRVETAVELRRGIIQKVRVIWILRFSRLSIQFLLTVTKMALFNWVLAWKKITTFAIIAFRISKKYISPAQIMCNVKALNDDLLSKVDDRINERDKQL